jgi:hypothetical protein
MTKLAPALPRDRIVRRSVTSLALLGALLLPRAARAEESELDYGKGMIELRLQTASNATSGALVASESTNGAYYSSVSQGVVIQAVVGGGYFLTPALELGADFSELYFVSDSSGSETTSPNVVGLAPFLRIVSGVKSWGPGVFVEASPGLFAYRSGNEGNGVLDLSLWAGGHFPLGAPLALVVGPIISRIDNVKEFGEGSFVLGLRFGMSLYFPRKKSAPAKP